MQGVQDCEEALRLVPWHQKCSKRRVDALHALGFSRAAYQASACRYHGSMQLAASCPLVQLSLGQPQHESRWDAAAEAIFVSTTMSSMSHGLA